MADMTDTNDTETSRRWLLKALREASGEMYELLMQAMHRSMPDAEALIERAWRQDTIAAWQLGHLLFQDVDDLPLHDFEWLEQTNPPDCYEQLREWYQLREQINSVLYMISSYEWEESASHRFQGELNVESIARAIHQTDLEILNTLRAQLQPT